MISKRLVNMASQAAKSSLLPDYKLKAKEGSALYHFVKAIKPDESLTVSSESLNNSLSNIVEKSSVKFAFTQTPTISLMLDEMEEVYITPLRNQVSFIKNVVNPIVRELGEKVEENIKDKEESIRNDRTVINIKSIDVPDFLFGSFSGIINHYNQINTTQKGPLFKPCFPNNLTRDDIINLCKHTSDEVNEGVLILSENWRACFGDDIFTTAYNDIILGSNENIGSMGTSYRNFMLSVIVFLIVDNISKRPIKGLNIDINNLTIWSNFVKTSCARVINSNINLFNNAIRNKILIYSVNPDLSKKEITVYGNMYNDFNNEDKIEIMLGILHTKDNLKYYKLDNILEDVDKLRSKGQYVLSISNRTSENMKISRMVDSIKECIVAIADEAINGDSKSDLRTFIPDSKMAFEYRKEVLDYIDRYYPGSTILKEDLKLVIANIICNIFFKDTLSGVIIQRMTQIELDNPNLSQASIFSQTMIDLLIEWVSGQIELVKYVS